MTNYQNSSDSKGWTTLVIEDVRVFPSHNAAYWFLRKRKLLKQGGIMEWGRFGYAIIMHSFDGQVLGYLSKYYPM